MKNRFNKNNFSKKKDTLNIKINEIASKSNRLSHLVPKDQFQPNLNNKNINQKPYIKNNNKPILDLNKTHDKPVIKEKNIPRHENNWYTLDKKDNNRPRHNNNITNRPRQDNNAPKQENNRSIHVFFLYIFLICFLLLTLIHSNFIPPFRPLYNYQKVIKRFMHNAKKGTEIAKATTAAVKNTTPTDTNVSTRAIIPPKYQNHEPIQFSRKFSTKTSEEPTTVSAANMQTDTENIVDNPRATGTGYTHNADRGFLITFCRGAIIPTSRILQDTMLPKKICNFNRIGPIRNYHSFAGHSNRFAIISSFGQGHPFIALGSDAHDSLDDQTLIANQYQKYATHSDKHFRQDPDFLTFISTFDGNGNTAYIVWLKKQYSSSILIDMIKYPLNSGDYFGIEFYGITDDILDVERLINPASKYYNPNDPSLLH